MLLAPLSGQEADTLQELAGRLLAPHLPLRHINTKN